MLLCLGFYPHSVPMIIKSQVYVINCFLSFPANFRQTLQLAVVFSIYPGLSDHLHNIPVYTFILVTCVLWQMMPLQSVKTALQQVFLVWSRVWCKSYHCVHTCYYSSSSCFILVDSRVHLFFIYFNSYASIYLRGHQNNYICLFFEFTINMEKSF